MSTPLKIGLAIVTIIAAIGAGFLGGRLARVQQAALVQPNPPIPVNQAQPGGRGPRTPEQQSPGSRGRSDWRGPRSFGERGQRGDRHGSGFQNGPSGRRGGNWPQPFGGQRGDNQRGPGFPNGQPGGRGSSMPQPWGFPGGNTRPGPGPNAMSGAWIAAYRDDINAAIASVLGLTPDAYVEATTRGQSAWTLARDQGMTAGEFNTQMVGALTPVLDKAVAGGSLTRTQAGAILARIKAGTFPGWSAPLDAVTPSAPPAAPSAPSATPSAGQGSS